MQNRKHDAGRGAERLFRPRPAGCRGDRRARPGAPPGARLDCAL